MLRLVYVSSAALPMSKPELLLLLEQARQKNAGLGVTGLLLYKDGNFMQALEGDEAQVRALYASISADPRHRDCIVIFEGHIEQRLFPDWSMGFRDLADQALRERPGFSPLMLKPFDPVHVRADPSGCLELFKFFSESR